MSLNRSHKCTQCGHDFETADEGQLRCPRCDSDKIEDTRFLFGTRSADELTVEDYIDALLAPCCGDSRNLSRCPLGNTMKRSSKEA